MRTTYDPEADVLSILLADTEVARTENIAPGVEVDFDTDGRVLSFEILGFSKKYDLQGLIAGPPDPWLPLATAASIFGLSPHTLRHQIHKGVLKGHRAGRNWTVHWDDLYDYLEKRSRKAKIQVGGRGSSYRLMNQEGEIIIDMANV